MLTCMKMKLCMTTDRIGPITASLEVWEMRNIIPTLREQSIVSLYQPAVFLFV
jgi:hypothetical protein